MWRKVFFLVTVSMVLAGSGQAQEVVVTNDGIGPPSTVVVPSNQPIGQTFTTPIAVQFLRQMSFWFETQTASLFEWTIWTVGVNGALGTIIERDTTSADSTGRKDVEIDIEMVPLSLQSVTIVPLNTPLGVQYFEDGWYDGGSMWQQTTPPESGDWPVLGEGDLHFEFTFAVPEPATVALLGTGILALTGWGVIRRRRG